MDWTISCDRQTTDEQTGGREICLHTLRGKHMYARSLGLLFMFVVLVNFRIANLVYLALNVCVG